MLQSLLPIGILFSALSVLASANIFEANTVEDVDMLIYDDPAEYRALFFYTQDDYDDYTDQRISSIHTIFDDPYDPSWEGESWIRGIDTGAHLMRIDARNPEFEELVNEFDVGTAPKVVVFDRYGQIVDDFSSESAYNKIRDFISPQESSFSGNQVEHIPPVTFVPEPVVLEPAIVEPVFIPPVQKCECPPSPPPAPCIPTGPTPSEVQSQCQSALELAQEAADDAIRAYEDLKYDFEEYRKSVEAEHERQDAYHQRGEDLDSIEEAHKDIDLFIKLRDSLKSLEEIQRQSEELEYNLRDAKKQVDYRMDDWMRRYERDYIDVQERKVEYAQREGFHEGYDEGYDDGIKKGKREGEDEALHKFAQDFKKGETLTHQEYLDEFGLDIIGEPRLVTSRLVEKGEPHDAVVIEEYELGDPSNRIFNITPAGALSPAHPKQRFIPKAPSLEILELRKNSTVIPNTHIKKKIPSPPKKISSKKVPGPKSVPKPSPALKTPHISHPKPVSPKKPSKSHPPKPASPRILHK